MRYNNEFSGHWMLKFVMGPAHRNQHKTIVFKPLDDQPAVFQQVLHSATEHGTDRADKLAILRRKKADQSKIERSALFC